MKKQELENTLALKKLFNIFKFVALTGIALCNGGFFSLRSIETAVSNLEFMPLEAREASNTAPDIISILQQFDTGTDDVRKGSLNFLSKFVGFFRKAVDRYPKYLQDLSPRIEAIEDLVKNPDEKETRLMKIKEIQRGLKTALKIKKQRLQTREVRGESEDALKVTSVLNTCLEMGSFIPGFEDDRMETAELLKLADAIDETDKKLLLLRKYEESVCGSITAMIRKLEGVVEAANTMDSKSRTALVITKWQVQRSLKNIQLQIKELTRGFKVQDGVHRCFNMLQEAITVLIQVYDRIESYREEQTLAKYMADISSVALDASDNHLSSLKNQLDIQVKRNLILNRYRTASNAFNQWTFPFSLNFTNDSKLPDPSRSEDRSIESLVSDCLANIERMKTNVEADRTLVMGSDRYLHHSDFSSQNVGTVPFFTWKKETHGNLISRLFSGKEIRLKADVTESPVNKDGIKFNFIEFQFRCRNESLQSRLDRLLKGFDVSATHTGNSYYRYENRIYLIPSDKLTFFYSFEKDENGNSVRKNEVYNKIRRGNVVLSPYTLWHLKLVNADSTSSFEKLKIFNADIDLELAGHGCYMTNFEELNLEAEHCGVVEVIDELDAFLD